MLAASPVAQLLPAEEAAHAVVAGILGLEMLASLDGDRAAALALFDRAQAVGDALDRLRPLAVLLDQTATLTELIAAARTIFEADLDAGHVTVLTEMISGAQSVPGLGERVAACLAPWRDFAATAVRGVLADSPVAQVLPADEAAHAVVAGILGLEMLASLDGDRAAALALFDRVRVVGDLLDRLRPLAVLLSPGLLSPGLLSPGPPGPGQPSPGRSGPGPLGPGPPDRSGPRKKEGN